MSVEDAAKLVMSAGVIQPDETQRRLQEMAEAARGNGRAGAVPTLEPS